MNIEKTPVTVRDEPFLFELYSETRQNELRLLPWDESQKNAFLRHQFRAQQFHYESKYGERSSFEIVTLDGMPVGRLYLAELDDEIRIVDITIAGKYRGRRIGKTLIEEILRKADSKDKCVRIYLEADNNSVGLFSYFGFRQVADEGYYTLWEKRPDPEKISVGAASGKG